MPRTKDGFEQSRPFFGMTYGSSFKGYFMKAKSPVMAIAAIMACFFLSFSFGLLIAGEMPSFIEFDQDVYKYNRKGPVPFEHEVHLGDYEIACDQCHHDYEDGENVWEEGDPVQKCASCHDPIKNQGDVKNLRLAFHKNCKGCHKRLKKEGVSDDAPFRKCSGCHEKKS